MFFVVFNWLEKKQRLVAFWQVIFRWLLKNQWEIRSQDAGLLDERLKTVQAWNVVT